MSAMVKCESKKGAKPRAVAPAEVDDVPSRQLDAETAPEAIPGDITPPPAPAPAPLQIVSVPLRHIIPGPNAREVFDPEALQELAASIQEMGVRNPVQLRTLPDTAFRVVPSGRSENSSAWIVDRRPGKSESPPIGPFATEKEAFDSLPRYELLGGERRLRACTILGLATIPGIVDQLDDRQAAIVSAIDNLQRKDLDPFEQQRAFRMLMDAGLSQHEISARTGISQGQISRCLGLEKHSDTVKALIREGKLSAAHAQRLLPLAMFPQAVDVLASHAVAQGWRAADLEWPMGWAQIQALQYAKVIVDLKAETPWNWKKTCREECPHKAFRASRHGDYLGHCFHPPCYRELNKTAKAEQKRTDRQEAEEASRRYLEQHPDAVSKLTPAQLQMTTMATAPRSTGAAAAAGDQGATAPGTPPSAASANAILPHIRTLATSFQVFPGPGYEEGSWCQPAGRNSQRILKRPAGCTEADCPCAKTVLDEKSRLVRICTDTKRVAALIEEERQRVAKERVKTFEQQRAECGRLIDQLQGAAADSPDVRRMFAMLAWLLLKGRYGQDAVVASVAKRRSVSPDAVAAISGGKDPIVRLAKYSPQTLAALILDTLTAIEAHEAIRYSYNRPEMPVTTTFLSVFGEPEKPPKAAKGGASDA